MFGKNKGKDSSYLSPTEKRALLTIKRLTGEQIKVNQVGVITLGSANHYLPRPLL
jgi:hypothetical protein